MRRDRPKEPRMRQWLVKLKGRDEPVEVMAEYRAAARHYAKCCVDEPEYMYDPGAIYRDVEWCRLKPKDAK